MDSKEMFRQVIMDHYKNPNNKVDSDPAGYLMRDALNPSCGDEIKVYLLIEDDVVIDLKFNGEGCSICCASASIMTNELVGLSKQEVITKINQFHDLIKDADDSNFDQFEDAQVLTGIKDFPARFKCAYLSWNTVRKLIEEQVE